MKRQVTSEEIAVEKKEAEVALEAAIPALEEAAEALNDLKKDDITEIRSFAKPHILVQKVRNTKPHSAMMSRIVVISEELHSHAGCDHAKACCICMSDQVLQMWYSQMSYLTGPVESCRCVSVW